MNADASRVSPTVAAPASSAAILPAATMPPSSNTNTDSKSLGTSNNSSWDFDVDEICRSCGKPNGKLDDLFSANDAKAKGDSSGDMHDTYDATDEPGTSLACGSNTAASTSAAANDTSAKATAQGHSNMENILQEMQIWQLRIKPNDNLPQRICSKCTAQFNLIHKFRRKCLKVQVRLRELYEEQCLEEEQREILLNIKPVLELGNDLINDNYGQPLSEVELFDASWNAANPTLLVTDASKETNNTITGDKEQSGQHEDDEAAERNIAVECTRNLKDIVNRDSTLQTSAENVPSSMGDTGTVCMSSVSDITPLENLSGVELISSDETNLREEVTVILSESTKVLKEISKEPVKIQRSKNRNVKTKMEEHANPSKRPNNRNEARWMVVDSEGASEIAKTTVSNDNNSANNALTQSNDANADQNNESKAKISSDGSEVALVTKAALKEYVTPLNKSNVKRFKKHNEQTQPGSSSLTTNSPLRKRQCHDKSCKRSPNASTGRDKEVEAKSSQPPQPPPETTTTLLLSSPPVASTCTQSFEEKSDEKGAKFDKPEKELERLRVNNSGSSKPAPIAPATRATIDCEFGECAAVDNNDKSDDDSEDATAKKAYTKRKYPDDEDESSATLGKSPWKTKAAMKETADGIEENLISDIESVGVPEKATLEKQEDSSNDAEKEVHKSEESKCNVEESSNNDETKSKNKLVEKQRRRSRDDPLAKKISSAKEVAEQGKDSPHDLSKQRRTDKSSREKDNKAKERKNIKPNEKPTNESDSPSVNESSEAVHDVAHSKGTVSSKTTKETALSQTTGGCVKKNEKHPNEEEISQQENDANIQLLPIKEDDNITLSSSAVVTNNSTQPRIAKLERATSVDHSKGDNNTQQTAPSQFNMSIPLTLLSADLIVRLCTAKSVSEDPADESPSQCTDIQTVTEAFEQNFCVSAAADCSDAAGALSSAAGPARNRASLDRTVPSSSSSRIAADHAPAATGDLFNCSQNDSEQSDLIGFSQNSEEAGDNLNMSVDTVESDVSSIQVMRGAPAIGTASHINDYINDFQAQIIDEPELGFDEEQQLGSLSGISSSSLNLNAMQRLPSLFPEPQRIGSQLLSESNLSELQYVESTLNGILSEMQDQHIYTPVSSHADDIFNQSVYSPLSDSPETPTHSMYAESPNSACLSMDPSSPYIQRSVNHVETGSSPNTPAKHIQPNRGIFSNGYPPTYGECFTEDSTQSELIGFQNDIPCFENIELAATTPNTSTIGGQPATASPSSQAPIGVNLQSDVQLSSDNGQESLPVFVAPTMPIVNTHFLESSSNTIAAEAKGFTPVDNIQLTQILNDLQQQHLTESNCGKGGDQQVDCNAQQGEDLLRTNSKLQFITLAQHGTDVVANDAQMHATVAEMPGNARLNLYTSIVPQEIQWSTGDANGGIIAGSTVDANGSATTTYYINTSDLYQPNVIRTTQTRTLIDTSNSGLLAAHQQTQTALAKHSMDANENYIEGMQQNQSIMIVIPHELMRDGKAGVVNANSTQLFTPSGESANALALTQPQTVLVQTPVAMQHSTNGLTIDTPNANSPFAATPQASPARRKTAKPRSYQKASPPKPKGTPPPDACSVQQQQKGQKVNLACRFCHKRQKFTNNLDYSNHIIAMHPAETPYNCPHCPMHFTRRMKRQHHILEAHAAHRFQCAQCGQNFCAQRSLDLHLQRSHAPEMAQQPQQQQQQQQQQQNQHYLQQRAPWQDNEDSSATSLVHVEDVHLDVSEEGGQGKKSINLELSDSDQLSAKPSTSTQGTKRSRILCCPDCDDSFDDGHNKDSHTHLLPQTATTHVTMPSPEQTEPDSTSTTTLRQFRKRRSSGSNLSEFNACTSATMSSLCQTVTERNVLRGNHNCLFCEEHFTNEIALRKHHQLAHSNQASMPFVCSICKRGYRMRTALQRHMETHDSEGRPYECSLCHVRFPRPSQLTLHKLTVHFLKRPHACNECGKQFGTESALKTHIKFHGEKKVACDICDRKFFLTRDMRKHRRIHTGERFYKCDLCFSSFLHYTRLCAHMKTHLPLGMYLGEDALITATEQKQRALTTEQATAMPTTTDGMEQEQPQAQQQHENEPGQPQQEQAAAMQDNPALTST